MVFNHFVPTYAFDNKSFDILRLVLTIEASFIGSVLLMHQHRQAVLDRRITLSDYIVELQIQKELKQIRPLIEDIYKNMEREKKL